MSDKARTSLRRKQLQAITKEITSLRDWLNRLEREAAVVAGGGVISAVIILSISESCTKLTYGAGVVNGAELSKL